MKDIRQYKSIFLVSLYLKGGDMMKILLSILEILMLLGIITNYKLLKKRKEEKKKKRRLINYCLSN